MGRALKPQKVGEIESSNHKVCLPIMLDKNHLVFFVEIPGVEDSRVQAASVEEVKTAARKMLDHALPYDWKPMIGVSMEMPEKEEERRQWAYARRRNENEAELKFSFERFEISPVPIPNANGVHARVQRSHALDFESSKPDKIHRVRRENNEDVNTFWDSHFEVIVPYDQEVWDGLINVRNAVNDAKSRLQSLFARKDVSEKLRRIATIALPPMLPSKT